MSDLYTSLNVSPRKKRCPPERDDDTVSPKKLRMTAPSHRPFPSRKSKPTELPQSLSRLCTIYTELQSALSHALATCAVSPTSDTGIVRNVLNHISLSTYTGITTSFDVEDLRRLCWVLEWDGKTRSSSVSEEENPFLDEKPVQKDWTRGGMGVVISAASHHLRIEGKRVPAYGLGIEVEMDIDKDMTPGMAAVARWTAENANRCNAFRDKLQAWVKLHQDVPSLPALPLADLPRLAASSKSSSLTRTLASLSPKSAAPTFKLPATPTSPSRSPVKSKLAAQSVPIPFPRIAGSPTKNSLAFPQTPSSRTARSTDDEFFAPRTPKTSLVSPSKTVTVPSTPVHQRGANATTVPATPTSSRRQALYERLRQRSISASPTKGAATAYASVVCLVVLGGVAEGIWMLFSAPTASASTTATPRKRRALPLTEVTAAVIKSSPVPISSAEAVDSVAMLVKLCPFFLKQFAVAGEAWLEMPASSTSLDASPSKKSGPASPGNGQLLVTRSPRKVKNEAGGLREVREIIRRELELQD
ncbi:CDT1-C domain-containing protein [Mycena indigotica]|uniref:CDT1-C domain-containing protein n=1 Tax=Mycena indigotica TaxID=2126181 RepID=A0A8H6W3B7_9AGAR|nr:CDT1-C domain-containing protein [Mycena indigotica]KAF7301396.1 CDT1-C domain-containing protein [Mycena indigotica]